MAEGRSRALWSHTSHVLALLANCHRDPRKGRPFSASQFNPHARPRARPRPVSAAQLADDIMRVAESRKRRRR